MKKTKLYCYVDETGQDGLQKFFLVSIIITSQNKKDGLEKLLEELEEVTGKKKLKWTKTKAGIRQAYIKSVTKIDLLKNAIYYSTYPDGKAYTDLTSLTIAKAVLAKNEKEKIYRHALLISSAFRLSK